MSIISQVHNIICTYWFAINMYEVLQIISFLHVSSFLAPQILSLPPAQPSGSDPPTSAIVLRWTWACKFKPHPLPSVFSFFITRLADWFTVHADSEPYVAAFTLLECSNFCI